MDDDTDVRELLCIFLESEGYRTVSATCGARALELLTDIAPPALILLDMMMPDMSGLQVMDALRADTKLASIPVIIVSASPEALSAGIPFMKKPVCLEDLLEAVREHSRRITLSDLPT